MRKLLLMLIVLYGCTGVTEACRFTVREIGFSTLSGNTYTLVVLDGEQSVDDLFWEKSRQRLADSNIKLILLDTAKNKESPLFRQIMEERTHLPNQVLVAPDGSILDLSNVARAELIDVVLDSPVRKRLQTELADIFSVVLWVEGRSADHNSEVAGIIQKNCEAIQNIMPHMPKEVKRGPAPLKISADDFVSEKILLWALGIEQVPREPVAFVLYGRGSVMGEAVEYPQIRDNRLYEFMGMIGADCECGLDRKWMLGNQIPMLWPTESRQQLANEVGFDVDNPMILAEMSRILAKEETGDQAGGITFGPQVINLEEAFGMPNEDKPETNGSLISQLIKIAGLSVLFILLVGGFIYFKRRE